MGKMTLTWRCWCWKLGLASLLAMGGAIADSGDYAKAQITPDGTLPNNSIVTPQGNTSLIEGGTQAGSNLFHSFEQFSIPTRGEAYFNNAADIQNIISRVTGSSISNIDGLLRANGTANVFLLNPNGIIFGPNASLNIGGSFVATTANAIQFGNQGFFSASAPDVPSVLTVNPSAFFFNQIAAASIQMGNIGQPPSNSLSLAADRSLLLLGGNVLAEGANINLQGGRVEFGGVAGLGVVGLVVDGNLLRLSFPEQVERADVLLNSGARVNVTAEGGGSIAINARNLALLQGSILSAGIGAGLGSTGSRTGDITINATGAISITDFSGIQSDVQRNAVVDSGSVTIQARSLFITDGSNLSVTTDGQGSTGRITILVNGPVALANNSSIASGVRPIATGNSGNIVLVSESLSVTNGARVIASTRGQGNTGNVVIIARERVSFDGVGSNGISSGAYTGVGAEAVGRGGSVNVTTGSSLSVTNGARLTASTSGQGDAGSVNIIARDTVSFDGVGSNGISSGASSGVESTSMGNAGGINITTEALSTTNGAEVNVSSEGSGNAGNLEVAAGSLRLDNQAALNAESVSGRGGNIQLRVEELLLLSRDSLISAISGTTGSNGLDGNINIVTKFLVAAPSENSDIIATGFGRSVGSNIQVNAQGIFGTQFQEQRTPKSDIVATGTVELITPDVDPSRGLVNLPAELVNITGLISQSCPGRGNAGRGESEFIITGRGGLPPNPSEALRSDAVRVDLGTPIQGQENRASAAVSTNSTRVSAPTPIVEAQGWVIGANGEVILTARPPTVTPHSPWLVTADCHPPQISS